MYGTEIPANNCIGTATGFMSVFNKNEWASHRLSETWPRFKYYGEEEAHRVFIDQFTEAGVSEIVTVQAAGKGVKFKQINPTSPKAEEGIVAIHYETVSKTRGNNFRFDYAGPDGRNGNYLAAIIYLPSSDAEELLGAMQEDPNTIREVIDASMREQIGADKSWDQTKPPYERWQEANGGVSRIALRASLEQGVDQSQILEFKTAV